MRGLRATLVMIAAAACAPEAEPLAEPETAMTLSFAARVGDAPFSCSAVAHDMGTSAAAVEPLDFRLYVHDVRLVTSTGREVPFHLADDGKWQTSGVALLDFEDRTGTCVNGTAETNTILRGTAPRGPYTGLKLKIGVPFALNHADAATARSPLNLSGLFWGWNGGYKFVRIDARVAGQSGASLAETSAFNIHLGSVQCHGGPSSVTGCDRPDVGEVVLRDFDPEVTPVLVDYRALVAGTDLTRDLGGAPGCMSDADDADCPSLLARLGVNPTTGQPDASQQALFRVE